MFTVNELVPSVPVSVRATNTAAILIVRRVLSVQVSKKQSPLARGPRAQIDDLSFLV